VSGRRRLLPVLRPDAYSAAWVEFRDALDVALGDPEELGYSGLCQGSTYFAERLLEARGYDVAACLLAYRELGGHCDCTILQNVDPLTLEDELDELLEDGEGGP
jgi:hypothetical protein